MLIDTVSCTLYEAAVVCFPVLLSSFHKQRQKALHSSSLKVLKEPSDVVYDGCCLTGTRLG